MFECPRLLSQRKDLLGPHRSWEDLDDPNWRKEERDDSGWDTIEAFFGHVYTELS